MNRRSTQGTALEGATKRPWLSELTGGLAGALAAFSIAVPLGALAFAPLGVAFAGLGVATALVGSTIGSVVAGFAGSNALLRSGPMTALCLIVSGVMATLLVMPEMRATNSAGLPHALALVFACILLAGLLQILFGLLRLGHAIKYVPRPVLSGFRLGLAAIIVLSQIPHLLGLAHPLAHYDRAALASAVLPWSLAVGVLSFGSILIARRAGFAAVSLFIGLVVGTLAHSALVATRDPGHLGATIGPLPSLLDVSAIWRSLFEVTPQVFAPNAILAILAPAAGIAIVASVLTLLAARTVEDLAGARTGSNRELMAQGLGNLVGGLFGGLPVAGSPAASIASYQGGGRTRFSALWLSALLVLGVTLAARWIATFPLAALAGVMLVVAFDLVDRAPLKILRDLRAGGRGSHEGMLDLAIIGAVAVASLLINIVAGVLTGVLIAAAVFAIKSSRNVVRRYSPGTMRRSFRQRGQRELEILGRSGAHIGLFELEGPIFFGTSERLADEVAAHAPDARFVVLDFARVNAVDATGAHVIDQLARRLDHDGGRLVIASLPDDDRRRHSLERGLPRAHAEWLPDVDRALEWCEERLLAEHSLDDAHAGELALDRIDLCRDLDQAEIELVRGAVTRECHAQGAVIFREGDAGDCLYLLAKGAVSILIEASNGAGTAPRRIVTFAPGVTFGEQAILDGRPRSAAAVCDQDVVVYALSTATLQQWTVTHPQLAVKLHRAMAQSLAARLRATTIELHHVAGG